MQIYIEADFQKKKVVATLFRNSDFFPRNSEFASHR